MTHFRPKTEGDSKYWAVSKVLKIILKCFNEDLYVYHLFLPRIFILIFVHVFSDLFPQTLATSSIPALHIFPVRDFLLRRVRKWSNLFFLYFLSFDNDTDKMLRCSFFLKKKKIFYGFFSHISEKFLIF